MDTKKVEAIEEWKPPKDVHEVGSGSDQLLSKISEKIG